MQGAGRCGMSLLEVLLAAVLLVGLMLPLIGETRSGTRVSRHRLLRARALRELSNLIEVLSAERLRDLDRRTHDPPATWTAPGGTILPASPGGPLELTTAILDLGGTGHILLQARVTRVSAGVPALFRLTATASYRLPTDTLWTVVTRFRVVRRTS